MKLLKIFIILAVGALSLFAAVHFTTIHAQETAEKEKSLAEALLQNQIKAEIEKAEQKAQEELGEALVTTVVTTKPPETTTTAATQTEPVIETEEPVETAEPTEETQPPIEKNESTETAEPEEIITEFTRGGILPTDRTGIPVRSMFGLSEPEMMRVANFLIDHYFLDGNVYVANETRPALKEKKLLAHRMESGAIQAVNMIYGSIDLSDITSIMKVDYAALGAEFERLRDEFIAEYKGAEKYGEEFGRLYDGCVAYYGRLILAMSRMDDVADEYRNSTNAVLAAALMMTRLDDVIIPEIMAVLEESFGLIEASHEIFLEGTQGTRLLTREEVTDIIVNPALVLDTGLA